MLFGSGFTASVGPWSTIHENILTWPLSELYRPSVGTVSYVVTGIQEMKFPQAAMGFHPSPFLIFITPSHRMAF